MSSNPVLSSCRQQMRAVTCWLAIMVCTALAAAEEGGEPYYNSDPTDPCTGAWVCVRKPELVPPTISYSKDVWCYFDQVAITCDPPTWIPGLKRKANPNCAEERPVFQYGEVYAWQLYYDGPFNMETGGTPTGLIAGGPGGSFTEAACFIDPATVGKPPLPPVPPDGQGGGTVPPPQGAAGQTFRWQKLKVGPVVVFIDIPGKTREYTPNLRDRTGSVYFSKGLTGVDLFHPPGSNGVCGLGAWMTFDSVGCGSIIPQIIGSEECSSIKQVFVDEVIEVEELGCLPDASPIDSLCGKGWSKFYPRPLISAESCGDYTGPLEYIFEAEELRRVDTCTGGDPSALRKKKGACDVIGSWTEKKVQPIPYTAVDESGKRIRQELCAGKYRLVFKWISTYASDCDCVGPLIGEETTTFTIRELPKPEATIDTIKVNVPDDTWKLKVVTKKPYDDCNDYDKANYRVRIKGKEVPGKTAGQYLLDDQGKPTMEMVKPVHLGETVVFDMKGITAEKLANTKDADLYDVTWTVSIFDNTVCGYIDQKIDDVIIKLAWIDLDADTDNTSDPLTSQKKPDRTKTEDETEVPESADEPGLVLVVNHGFEEGGYGDGTNPREDWELPGIKADDEDLSVGNLTIKAAAGGTMVLTYTKSQLIVYRLDGGSPQKIESGAKTQVNPGDIELRLEGISAGEGKAPNLITAEFTPTGADKAAKDVIKVTVVDLQLQVDRDRDGAMDGKGQDLTDDKHPLVFWYNNDCEGIVRDYKSLWRPVPMDTPVGGEKDYDSNTIKLSSDKTSRDLEDFQRMRLKTRGMNSQVTSGRYGTTMQWTKIESGKPRMKFFGHYDKTASADFYTIQTNAEQIMSQKVIGEATVSAPLLMAKDKFQDEDGSLVVPMVWECDGDPAEKRPLEPEYSTLGARSIGQLGLVLRRGAGLTAQPVAANRHLHLSLADMRHYYEHWTAGDRYTDDVIIPDPVVSRAVDSGSYPDSDPERLCIWNPMLKPKSMQVTKDKVVIFAHGFRMATWERRAYAETFYKRMYWTGYNGKFVLLSWPTELRDPVEWGIVFPKFYDRSEFAARRSGYLFSSTINGLTKSLADGDSSQVILAAHSMGNVVLAEAMRRHEGVVAGRYFSYNSAEAAECFMITKDRQVSAHISRYQPNLYAFDAPVQGRGLVTALEWNGVDSEYGRNSVEKLRPVTDGLPLHRRLRNSVPVRISFYNGGDAATTGPWSINQGMKPDIDFTYRAELDGMTDDGRAKYHDEYVVHGNRYRQEFKANLQDLALLATTGSGYRLPWTPYAANAVEQYGRAAVLAFVIRPRCGAVGAVGPHVVTGNGASGLDFWGQALPLVYQSEQAPFTEGFNIPDHCGGEGDHSLVFNWALAQGPGPYWAYLRMMSSITEKPR